MTKFRKKPVEIKATQWFKNGDHPQDEIKQITHKGERYPCKPDIFEATYDHLTQDTVGVAAEPTVIFVCCSKNFPACMNRMPAANGYAVPQSECACEVARAAVAHLRPQVTLKSESMEAIGSLYDLGGTVNSEHW